MKQKVGIVTVTYNPNLNEFRENLLSYISQVETVVIVDNSTEKELISALCKLCSEYPSIKLVQWKHNTGVAFAQNFGIRYLIDNSFDFAIEMDQDSKLLDNYVDQIVENFYKVKSTIDQRIIALGCLAVNNSDGSIYDGYKPNIGFIKVIHTLSSGLLVDLTQFHKVGIKDELLFIDLVDWDWCWKALKMNFHTYIDTSLSIIHSMGDRHINFLNFGIGVPKPYRHYYAFRNSLYLLTKSHPPLRWKFSVIPLLIFKILFYPLILSQGYLRFSNMWNGIKDFLLKKMGKRDE